LKKTQKEFEDVHSKLSDYGKKLIRDCANVIRDCANVNGFHVEPKLQDVATKEKCLSIEGKLNSGDFETVIKKFRSQAGDKYAKTYLDNFKVKC
jgi:hypothetical protein